jgi:hypothetical protein
MPSRSATRAIVRDIGDAPTEGMVLNNLGEIHRKRGDLVRQP